MIVTAALAWYDEPPEMLAECVRGVAAVADRIVAIDGGYRRFPGALPASDPVQAETIRRTAQEAGIGCLVLVPDRLWAGQVEKRSHLLAAASVGTDWIAVIDADHIVHADRTAHDELAAMDPDVDVVSVWMWTPAGERAATNWHLGMSNVKLEIGHFFRALPGLRVDRFHWWYRATKNGVMVSMWYGERTTTDEGVAQRVLLQAPYLVEHRSLVRDEAHTLANRAFCNDRVKVVEWTGQEDDVPGLPAPEWDFVTVPY